MAIRKTKLIEEIKAAMADRRLAPSAVALNVRVSRKRLTEFLAGSGSLTSDEIKRVRDFLSSPSPSEVDEKDWKNLTRNLVQFDAVANDLVKHSVAYIADGEN